MELNAYCVEDTHTEIVTKSALFEMFERNFERWTQSSSSMDRFTKLALNCLRFVRPAAKIIIKTSKDQW